MDKRIVLKLLFLLLQYFNHCIVSILQKHLVSTVNGQTKPKRTQNLDLIVRQL